MADIDCHREMTGFHRNNVTLSNKQQAEMRTRRDAGRTRLKNGLDEAKKPQPKEVHSQGSYQMRTMVQDGDNDYDIDDGAYFAYDDLKDDDGATLTPLAARQRVCDALAWDGRLKQEATVKCNCVRQVYAAGYHIDIPVYRIVTTKDKNDHPVEYYELASGDEWTRSDARAVTRWFNGHVGELNAGESDGSQMRRVTKLTKKFARRAVWKNKTTSGICITKLVVDHFKDSVDRDDKALRETWKAIDAELQKSTEIKHPVLDIKLASAGDQEVTFFRDCLSDALKTLEVLDKSDCTRKQAQKVWDDVFDTDFFTKQPNDGGDNGSKGSAIKVTSAETARRNDGGGRFG
ncbi:cyclic GMP-AMP synthase DncV-like nucleotidyltransferase [Endothiovibrio diazotrophicus]